MKNSLFYLLLFWMISCESEDNTILNDSSLMKTKSIIEAVPIKISDLDRNRIYNNEPLESINLETIEDLYNIFSDLPNIPFDEKRAEKIDIDKILQNSPTKRINWNDVIIRTPTPGINGYVYDGYHNIELKISNSFADQINNEFPGASVKIKGGKKYIVSRAFYEVCFNIGINDNISTLPSPKCGFHPSEGIEAMGSRGYMKVPDASDPSRIVFRTNFLFIVCEKTSGSTVIIDGTYPFNNGTYEWNFKLIHY